MPTPLQESLRTGDVDRCWYFFVNPASIQDMPSCRAESRLAPVGTVIDLFSVVLIQFT